MTGYLQTYRQGTDIVTDSDLNYTIIRPVWLTNENEVAYELTHHNEPFKGIEVSRKSVVVYAAHLIKHPSEDVKDSVGVDKPGSDSDPPQAAVMKLNGFNPNM